MVTWLQCRIVQDLRFKNAAMAIIWRVDLVTASKLKNR